MTNKGLETDTVTPDLEALSAEKRVTMEMENQKRKKKSERTAREMPGNKEISPLGWDGCWLLSTPSRVLGQVPH